MEHWKVISLAFRSYLFGTWIQVPTWKHSIQRKHEYEKVPPRLQLFQCGRKTDFDYETSMQKGRSSFLSWVTQPHRLLSLSALSSKGPCHTLHRLVTSRPGFLVLQCWASSNVVTIALHVDQYYLLPSS